jgi:hypothetical protein
MVVTAINDGRSEKKSEAKLSLSHSKVREISNRFCSGGPVGIYMF